MIERLTCCARSEVSRLRERRWLARTFDVPRLESLNLQPSTPVNSLQPPLGFLASLLRAPPSRCRGGGGGGALQTPASELKSVPFKVMRATGAL